MIFLVYTLLAVPSVTYAMKGKRLLNNYGYYCEIVKTPKELANGCGHSLRVRGNADVILDLLAKNGIAVKGSMTTER